MFRHPYHHLWTNIQKNYLINRLKVWKFLRFTYALSCCSELHAPVSILKPVIQTIVWILTIEKKGGLHKRGLGVPPTHPKRFGFGCIQLPDQSLQWQNQLINKIILQNSSTHHRISETRQLQTTASKLLNSRKGKDERGKIYCCLALKKDSPVMSPKTKILTGF